MSLMSGVILYINHSGLITDNSDSISDIIRYVKNKETSSEIHVIWD
jgi:hypothetical protein